MSTAPVVRRIKAAAAGRAIDDDHHGAGFPFRFGGWDDDGVRIADGARTQRLIEEVPPAVHAP